MAAPAHNEHDTIKHREIHFQEPHEHPDQADAARQVLDGLEGIVDLAPQSPLILSVRYDIQHIYLRLLEDLLLELGFHLDNSLLIKLRRALYHYCEDAQRENLGFAQEHTEVTRVVFMDRYRHLQHGCRDLRSVYWRRYL